MESLESRTLLSYTFTYDPSNNVATAQGTAAVDSLVISPIDGFLEHSVNGGAFDPNWGSFTVPAAVGQTVNVTLSTGNGSSLQLGGNSGANVGGPASALFAAFNVVAPANTTDTVVIDDSSSTAADTGYEVDTGSGSITTATGINFSEPAGIVGGGITLKGSSGADTYNVLSTFSGEPVTIDGGSGGGVVNVGSTPSSDGGSGVVVVNVGSTPSTTLGGIGSLLTVNDLAGSATLNLLDAGDTTSADAIITGSTVTGLGFGAGGSVAYTGGATTGVTALNVDGGTNGGLGITYIVDGTTAATTTLNTGPNADTVNIEATGTSAPLFIHGFDGADTVNIGDLGSVLGILGDVHIDNATDFTAINVFAYADTNGHNALLNGAFPAELSGVAPANIFYTVGDASSLSLTMGDASLSSNSNNLTIDFSTGNPIPFDTAIGLAYNAGNGLTNTLNLQGDLPGGSGGPGFALPGGSGGPGFASEVHNANDPGVFPQNGQYGDIEFVDQNGTPTGLTYVDLTPINDTANATNYTFNDFADDQSFTAQNGPTVFGFDTIQFVNTPAVLPPTFETTNVANKINIVFNTPPLVASAAGPGVIGTVNVPTPSTGLASLTFNMATTDGDNTVSFVATPPGVATSLVGGAAEDVTNVTGLGVATGTTLFLNGGPGVNTLNYDAGGETPAVTAGTLPGEVLIAIPGFGTVDAINYQTINLINVAPIVITPGPAVTINSVEGFQLVNAIVGTFTAPIGISELPAGFPASDFTATIDWGDPSPDLSAGTITQDLTSNPSVYNVTGTHTFVDEGTYTVANTVAFLGGSVTSVVNGVTVTVTLPPSGPTTGNVATATVTDARLTGSTGTEITGVEGISTGTVLLGTFVDANQAATVADYTSGRGSVVVNWGDGTVQTLAASNLTAIGAPPGSVVWTINAAHIYLEEGTYSYTVTVTDDGGASTVVAGAAIIADAPLSPVNPQPTVGATEGINTGLVPVATFTDANPTATIADYTSGGGSVVVNWGDGTPETAGTVSQPGGVGTPFIVSGAHTYIEESTDLVPPTYTITVNIVDDGGSRLTTTTTASIADAPLSPVNPQPTVGAIEGINTGLVPVATFVDANPTATIADYTSGGGSVVVNWGDGTPETAGTVSQPGGVGTPFIVSGAHTYIEESTNLVPPTYTITVNIVDDGGSRLTTTTTASVTDAPLSPANPQPTVNAIERINTGLVPVATFTDANPTATIADFTATIDWGDGSSRSPGLVTQGATGVFTVSGPHTYMEESTNRVPPTFTITVNIVDDGGSHLTTTTTASVVSPFVVTNTRDSGLGSLQFAIQVANADLNHDDTITFQIPASDPHYNPATGSWTIPVGAGLTIAKTSSEGGQHSVVIAGLSQQSQPGASITHPVIEITPAAGFVGDGLTLDSGGNTVQGLVIDGFKGAGLVLNSGTDNNLVVGNFVGIDPTGTVGRGNTFDGISLNDASNNTIGGTGAGAGNVISGNGINQDAAGIDLESNDRNNIIAGNKIGTNAAGTAALGNSLHGIFLGNGSSNNTIGGPTDNDRNVISGNGQFPVANLSTQGGVGVYIYGANTSGNVVLNNYIGTNVEGTAALRNSVIGVLIYLSSRNSVQRNLISGNGFFGLEIAGGTASGNLVQGNKIGTNAGGTAAIPNGSAAIPNGGDGILINNAPNNMIGGTPAGAGNLISGNSSVGIQLFGPLTKGNVIEGNALGLNSAGRLTLRNRAGGIFVNTGPLNNKIGGTAPGQANRGQIVPLRTLPGSQQSDPGSTAQAATAAGRRFRIRGRARISPRAHSQAH